MSEKSKLGLSIALLIGCAVWLSMYFGGKPKPGEPVRHLQPLACAACGAAYAGEAGPLPEQCEKCGKKEAYRALKCRGCGKIFPLIRSEESFAGAEAIKCSHCGKSAFTEVSPNDLSQP